MTEKELAVHIGLGAHEWISPRMEHNGNKMYWIAGQVQPDKFVFKVCKVCREVQHAKNSTWKVPEDSVISMRKAADDLYGPIEEDYD